ncbi:MAG: hypothetical protein ACK5U1_02780, partial [Cyclobacteriaceae bacterium]
MKNKKWTPIFIFGVMFVRNFLWVSQVYYGTNFKITNGKLFFISLKKKDNNLLIALLFFFSAKPACSLKVSNPSHAVKTVYNLPFVLFADKFFWVHYLHPQA